MSARKCPCGCGQATSATTRMRKLECDSPGCLNHCRQSRQLLAFFDGMTCPCGGVMRPACDIDAADAGDTAAEARVRGRMLISAQQAEHGRKGGAARARQAKAEKRARELRGEANLLPF